MQLKNISRSALLKRLDRHLRRVDGEQLHTSRAEDSFREFGEHYTTDMHSGNVRSRHVDPEEWARDRGPTPQ